MSWFSATIDVVGASARHQIIAVRSHPMFLVGGVFQPAVMLFVMLFAWGKSTGEQVTTVATAVLLMAYWGSTAWQGASILRRERFLGTLKHLMRGARNPMLVLIGKSLGSSLAHALLTIGTVTVVLSILRLPLSVAAPGWFVVGLVVAIISGTALGTLLCSLFLLTRYGPQLSSALLYPVYLLGGLLIPADFFPSVFSWLGWFVSLRWAQQFLVSTSQGTPDFAAISLVVLLTFGYALAGVAAFRRIDTLVRKRGTIDLG